MIIIQCSIHFLFALSNPIGTDQWMIEIDEFIKCPVIDRKEIPNVQLILCEIHNDSSGYYFASSHKYSCLLYMY